MWGSDFPADLFSPEIERDEYYTVPQLINELNCTIDIRYDETLVEGEIASFKINQNKWVFFDLKGGDCSLSCFMPLGRLSIALEDGMKVRVLVTPKITPWGKFSLTVKRIQPRGQGSIKKSFELLKAKLKKEGLFDPFRKRPLPEDIQKIGVISSTGAAGYHDFLKIIDNRWGGLTIQTINTQVQGLAAAEQVSRALDEFNVRGEVDVIVILRGGGSADDLAAFNDEALARRIAASRIPVVTGIGHEVDESLADLVADLRASTPSNAAELLSSDRRAIKSQLRQEISRLPDQILDQIDLIRSAARRNLTSMRQEILHQINLRASHIRETTKVLRSLDPTQVLRRGYSIIRAAKSNFSPGDSIEIITEQQLLTAEVKNAQKHHI